MAFYNVTYNEKHDFATVRNYGCTFKCPICSYKLRSGPEGRPGLAYPRPESFLTPGEIEEALLSVMPGRVNFMGGEPTVSKDLPRILRFAKEVLGAKTSLGHTNGCNLSLENIDSANVGLKAWYEDVHMHLTGLPKKKIYGEVEAAVKRGMDISANLIFIPGYVDTDQIELTAEFLDSIGIDKFHIMGYIPVPGQDFRRPTINEMENACNIAKRHIPGTGYSHMTPEEVLSMERIDDRFDVRLIAGSDEARGLALSNAESASIR